MRVVVGDVKRSVKRDDVRTDGVPLGLSDGPLVRIGGTSGATNGSAASNTCSHRCVILAAAMASEAELCGPHWCSRPVLPCF